MPLPTGRFAGSCDGLLRAVLALGAARLAPIVLHVRPPQPPGADLELVQMAVLRPKDDLRHRKSSFSACHRLHVLPPPPRDTQSRPRPPMASPSAASSCASSRSRPTKSSAAARSISSRSAVGGARGGDASGDMGDIPSAVPVRGPVGDVGAEDPAADCALEAARGPWLDRGADDLQPGPVGRSSLALPAPAPEDLDAMARGVLGKLVREVGLADARLPDQQDEAAAAASAWSSATVGSASSTLR